MSESLVFRVARFVGCLDDLGNLPALRAVLVARGLTTNCGEKYLRCPVCGFAYSRRSFWKHVYSRHLDEIVQAVEEWRKRAEKRT
jgi:uncharacterized C2H2 Zn-finger protein